MKITIKHMVLISLMTVLIFICTIINIPVFSVPFTLQTFAIFFALLILEEEGIISIVLYILLGVVCLPVFSNGNSLLGPTGGYILGFLFIGLSFFIFKKIKNDNLFILIGLVVGLIVCYALGSIWFYIYMGKGTYTLFDILKLCVLPFIIPDLAKLALAFFISIKVKKYIK